MRKLIIILLLIIISGCSKPIEPSQDAELYQEEWVGGDAENLSVEEKILIEMQDLEWPEQPKVVHLPIPTELKDVQSLPDEEYKNLDIKLNNDISVNHNITFEKCRIDLADNTLTFLPLSNVKIISSTITNAPKNPEDNERMKGKPATRKPLGLAVTTHNFILKDSIVKYSKGHGIHLLDSRKAVITNTTFFDNKWAAIRAERSFVTFINNTMINNGCENNNVYCAADSAFFNTITYTNAKGGNFVSNYLAGDMLFVNAIKVNTNKNAFNKSIFQFSTGAVSNNFISRILVVASEFLEVKDNFMKTLPEVSSGYEGKAAKLKSSFPNYVDNKWTEEYTKHDCTKFFPENEYCAMVFSKEEVYAPI